MRLDKFLSNQTGLSRKEVKELLRRGGVTVNGKGEKSADRQIDPEKDTVLSGGKQVLYKPYIYIMMNKPVGVVSASRDPKEKTVLDLLAPEDRHRELFPAGRLDKDTTGFVLLTDDGDFAHRILAPGNHVPKTYLVGLAEPVTQACVDAFSAGMTLANGEVCRPAELTLPDPENRQVAQVVLREGMYHQIKRMFGACGNRVISLKRIKIGNLPLDQNLEEGAYREILHKELEQIL